MVKVYIMGPMNSEKIWGPTVSWRGPLNLLVYH